jgi:2-polyprenyl-3-methyl-5-hydroxy-6-metoxy-1,4-benzoquinol methylase
MNSKSCWCGNQDLSEFSPDYSLCSECGTLVLNEVLTLDEVRVHDDEHGLYGKEYWLSHQTKDFGYPDIYQRSRQDTPERCLYWLHTLMKYKSPPAKVLELGCSHGSSVALVKWAGFEATGLELSPWVVEFAKKTFDIPMLLGPIEDQSIETETLDVIVLYDVLEHLPNPFVTMSIAASLLKEDGIFIVQIPNYQENKTYEEMSSQNDSFLSLMIPEHTYLFSHRSISEFFKRLGFNFIQYEPQFFDYDMYFVASRNPVVKNTDEQISHNLLKRSSGRMILALLDQNDTLKQLRIQYDNSERDREERLRVIERQGEEIGELLAHKNRTVEDFQYTQSQLNQSQSELQHTQSQLNQSQSELQHTQSQLNQSQSELQHIQSQLNQSQSELQSLEQEKLLQLNKEIEQIQTKIEITNTEINAMKTSKFWKTRSLWFNIKSKLGMT